MRKTGAGVRERMAEKTLITLCTLDLLRHTFHVSPGTTPEARAFPSRRTQRTHSLTREEACGARGATHETSRGSYRWSALACYHHCALRTKSRDKKGRRREVERRGRGCTIAPLCVCRLICRIRNPSSKPHVLPQTPRRQLSDPFVGPGQLRPFAVQKSLC